MHVPNRRVFFPALSLLVLSATVSSAEPVAVMPAKIEAPTPAVESVQKARPKVGLALSGGGARGAAHIGVLKALEQQGIPIDCIAGTSMGAIVGGLYAAGLTPTEIENTFARLDWSAGFRDKPQRQDLSFRRKQDDKQFLLQFDVGFRDGEFRLPRGLVQGQNLNLILKTLVNRASTVRDFDKLRVPFRAVAADLETGDARVLKNGDLAEAVRASMTIPGVYEPLERDGYLLVDGGVADNLPVHVVRQLCADIVIAVDVSSPLLDRHELGSLVEVIDQLSTLLTRRNTEASISLLRDGDIYLRPDLSGIGATDFNKIQDAIARGSAIADVHQDWLKEVATRTGTGTFNTALPLQPAVLPVQRISLDNSSGLATKAILARLSQDLGAPFDERKMQRDLDDLYGTGVFGVLDYKQIKHDDGLELLLHTPENPLGPHYFRFGLQLEDNFSGDSVYNLGVRHTYMPANDYGGEWRNEIQLGSNPRVYSEWFQPISIDGRWFISASGEWQRRGVQLRDDQNITSEYIFTGDLFRAEFGHQFGAHGHVLTGLRKGSGDLEERIGSSGIDQHGLDVAEWYLHAGIDRLDHRYFPRRGRAGSLTLARGSEYLGADLDYEKVLFDWLEVKTFGRHTLGAQLLAGSFIDEDVAPVQEQFQLGGFLRLSGYSKNELLGEHLRLFNLYYLFRLDQQFSATLDLPVYVGGSLEAGNVWQRKAEISSDERINAGSIFIGIDTQLGPLYLAYGKNSEQRDAVYLYLGAPF